MLKMNKLTGAKAILATSVRSNGCYNSNNKLFSRYLSSFNNNNNNRSNSNSSISTNNFDSLLSKPSIYDLSQYDDVDLQSINWQYSQSLSCILKNFHPIAAESGNCNSIYERIDWDYCIQFSHTHMNDWIKNKKSREENNLFIKHPSSSKSNSSKSKLTVASTDKAAYGGNSYNFGGHEIKGQKKLNRYNERINDASFVTESKMKKNNRNFDVNKKSKEYSETIVVESTNFKNNERSIDDVIKEAKRATVYFEAIYIKTYENGTLFNSANHKGKHDDQHPHVTYDHLIAWYNISPQAVTQIILNFNRYSYALECWIARTKESPAQYINELDNCIYISSGLIDSLEVICRLPTTQGKKLQEQLKMIYERIFAVDQQLKDMYKLKKNIKPSPTKTRLKKLARARYQKVSQAPNDYELSKSSQESKFKSR